MSPRSARYAALDPRDDDEPAIATRPPVTESCPTAEPRPADKQLGSEDEPGIGPFQDLPRWIWAVFLGGWAAFFGQLLAFFTTSRSATFMVVISVLFAVIAFGLVLSLTAQGRVPGAAPPTVVHTLTGPLSPKAAAAQVALIPVAVAFGLTAFILLVL